MEATVSAQNTAVDCIDVSVILTCYNASDTLAETLHSIAGQTYRNFELIVVDDGSTDDTPEILNRWKKGNKNLKCLLYRPGKIGRGKALNFGVSKAKAPWIAICDADDIWHPMKLEFQVDYLHRHSSVDVLGTDGHLFRDKAVFTNLNNEQGNGYGIQRFTLGDFLQVNRIAHSSVMIRKPLAAYDETRNSQFDYSLWLRLLEKGRRVEVILLPLAFHRIHNRQFFEGRKGKTYQWNSFTLKAKYCLKAGNLSSLGYVFFKLLFDTFLPRAVRHYLRRYLGQTYVQ